MTILETAKKDFQKGIDSGLYVRPSETNHVNYKAGELYNRMLSYINDLESK